MSTPKCLPTINLSSKAVEAARAAACKEVRAALEEYGCFIAIYDDFAVELHDKVFSCLESLFNLPIETKAKNVSSKPFHGYSAPQIPFHLIEGTGIADAQDLHMAQSFTDLMWPSGNPHFCQTINQYSKQTWELEQLVKTMLLESYGIAKQSNSLNESSQYLVRAAKYRPPTAEESNIGSVPHTDKSFLTVLHQNDVDGLEVQTKDAQHWLPYIAAPQSFVVMAGEALLAWSNNRILAPIHRVVMSGEKLRYSLATFSIINGEIATPEELVDEEHPLQFKPFSNNGLLEFYCKQVNTKVSNLTIKDYCGV